MDFYPFVLGCCIALFFWQLYLAVFKKKGFFIADYSNLKIMIVNISIDGSVNCFDYGTTRIGFLSGKFSEDLLKNISVYCDERTKLYDFRPVARKQTSIYHEPFFNHYPKQLEKVTE